MPSEALSGERVAVTHSSDLQRGLNGRSIRFINTRPVQHSEAVPGMKGDTNKMDYN